MLGHPAHYPSRYMLPKCLLEKVILFTLPPAVDVTIS